MAEDRQRRRPQRARARKVFGNRGVEAVSATVRAGAALYDRARHLPWLARATPEEIASHDPEIAYAIVMRLARALRAERRRGRAGHWTYDMNRHIALMHALAAETSRLAKQAGVQKANAPAAASDRGA